MTTEEFIIKYCYPVNEIAHIHQIPSENIDFDKVRETILRLPSYYDFQQTLIHKIPRLIKLINSPTCEICGKKTRTIHHKSYEHIQNIHLHLDDLQTLCNDCHIATHKSLEKQGISLSSPWGKFEHADWNYTQPFNKQLNEELRIDLHEQVRTLYINRAAEILNLPYPDLSKK